MVLVHQEDTRWEVLSHANGGSSRDMFSILYRQIMYDRSMWISAYLLDLWRTKLYPLYLQTIPWPSTTNRITFSSQSVRTRSRSSSAAPGSQKQTGVPFSNVTRQAVHRKLSSTLSGTPRAKPSYALPRVSGIDYDISPPPSPTANPPLSAVVPLFEGKGLPTGSEYVPREQLDDEISFLKYRLRQEHHSQRPLTQPIVSALTIPPPPIQRE